jgi:hypothetical protein
LVGVDEVVTVGHKGDGQSIRMSLDRSRGGQGQVFDAEYPPVFHTHGSGDVEPAVNGIGRFSDGLHPLDFSLQTRCRVPPLGQFDDQQMALCGCLNHQASADVAGLAGGRQSAK